MSLSIYVAIACLVTGFFLSLDVVLTLSRTTLQMQYPLIPSSVREKNFAQKIKTFKNQKIPFGPCFPILRHFNIQALERRMLAFWWEISAPATISDWGMQQQ